MRRGVPLAWAGTVVVASICGGPLPSAAQSPTAEADRTVAVQVLLDRARFSPGEIDGRSGPSTARAIEGFERTRGVSIGEAVAGVGEPPTVSYTIGVDDASGPFFDTKPQDKMEKAKLAARADSKRSQRPTTCCRDRCTPCWR